MVVLNADGTALGAPVGGATAAKQDDIITAIQAIPGGGGTQYTEAATDTTITGTAIMWEDASDTLRAVSAAKPLPVSASIDTTGLATTTTDTNTGTIAGDTTSIDSKIPALGQALAAASVPVVLPAAQITTLTPPAAITGFATSAKQDTIIGHVDGIEGLLTTIDSDTGTIATEVAGLLTDTELRATPVPVSGTVTANLGATDNAVLDAIAASTAAIETAVEGTLTVTGGGGGVEYTEDAAAAADPVGGALIMVRDDALSGQTTTDGDNVAARGTDKGELYVKHVDAIPVTDNGGVLTVDGTVAVTNAGITTIAGAVSGTEMQVDVLTMPTTTVTATDLDVRPLVNTDVVTAELSATDNAVLDTIDAVLDTINAKLVTGTVIGDVNLGATDNAVLDTIAAKDFATQTTLAAMNAKLVTGTVIGDVNLGATDNAVLDTIATNTGNAATSLGTLDNAISGSEIQVDVVGALPAGTNTIGAVKSVPSDIDINGSNANHADKYYTNAGAVTDGIVWSPAAGKRWHILTLYINVSAAATVTLEDDLAGGDVVRWKGELAANSGVVLKYDKEHPFCSGEDAADLIITTSAGNVYVQAVGYEV